MILIDVSNEQEKDCIVAAQSGCKTAFAELFQSHYSFLYKYLIKITLNRETTEDLIQETMLKGFLNIKRYNFKSKFSSWLITIATRTYFDQLRRQKVEKNWLEKEALLLTRQLKWELQTNGDRWLSVMDELAKLAPDVRSAILLVHYYGFTYAEVGQTLQLKEGTVKSKVHYGLLKLRKELLIDE